jgi:hypothetical protein
MLEWLPEFALSWSDREALKDHTAVSLLRRAAAVVYATDKYKRRGEFGELLLHVLIRQVFDTVPAISKIYYKDSPNDTVKGFDAVHIVVTDNDLELWLGEAKFYDDFERAARDAATALKEHSTRNYLRTEFAAITNKLDRDWPHYERLKRLLDPNTSLDAVFDRLSIPVLLTYDSTTLARFAICSEEYVTAFLAEIERHYVSFIGRPLPKECRIHLFLVPLHTKAFLLRHLHRKLEAWQEF